MMNMRRSSLTTKYLTTSNTMRTQRLSGNLNAFQLIKAHSNLETRTTKAPNTTSWCFRARIVQALEEHDDKLENNADRIKFKVSINNDEYEEILTYNQVLDHIQRDEDTEIVWK